MTTDKAQVRADIRAARDTFVASTSATITVPPAFQALLTPGGTVTAYIPLGSEADPAPLTQAALEAGCVLALPYVTRRSEPMRFLAWKPGEELVGGPFGLQQPAAGAQEVVPDIILTPLVAFDSKLDRLGQGAGYYDRAFARFPNALRIGVAWSVQRVDSVPTDAWDMPLHAIITENGWISTSCPQAGANRSGCSASWR